MSYLCAVVLLMLLAILIAFGEIGFTTAYKCKKCGKIFGEYMYNVSKKYCKCGQQLLLWYGLNPVGVRLIPAFKILLWYIPLES